MSPSIFQRDARFVLFGLDGREKSWRGVALLAAVFLGSLLLAGALTPPVYWLVQAWCPHTAQWQWLLTKGVDVYFDRLRMLAILCGLPWLMSVCHLWSWQGLGLSFAKSDRSGFSIGWLGGIMLIVCLAMVQGVSITVAGGGYLGAAGEALLAGLLLGFLEETIFRGLILRIFYTATRSPLIALVATSAFYAYTHFKVPASVWQNIAPGVHWNTGFFVAYWTTFGVVVDFDCGQFIVLWLLGMVLGALMLRHGSLLPAIGLHAGLVSAMFFYRGADLAQGWGAAIILGALFLMLTQRKPQTGNHSDGLNRG